MRYPTRVELFRQGEPPESVFLLEQGLIKLMRVESGGTEIIVGMRSAGWFLGAASVILDRPYLVSAVTVTDAQVSRIGADAFRERLRSDPKAGACGSVLDVIHEPRLNHRVELDNGVMAEECAALLKSFFQTKRKKVPGTD